MVKQIRFGRGVLGIFVLCLPHWVTAEISGSPMMEEIIVTAQKREERLQETPVSVTAFTGDSILRPVSLWIPLSRTICLMPLNAAAPTCTVPSGNGSGGVHPIDSYALVRGFMWYIR